MSEEIGKIDIDGILGTDSLARYQNLAIVTAVKLNALLEREERCCENGFFGDGHECLKQPGKEERHYTLREITELYGGCGTERIGEFLDWLDKLTDRNE